MSSRMNRREFVAGAAALGAVGGLGDFGFLGNLPPLSAAQVQVNPNLVQLNADIEPVVRFIETTARNQLIEQAANRVRNGTLTYQQLLAALLLAGVRNIKPRPVGYQFHAVLVINSAHLASIAAQNQDRWLPLFWALDYFKEAEQIAHNQNTWHMQPLNAANLPAAHQARQRFIDAMDNWDEEAADSAIAAFVRAAGASEVIELFWRYGARDFRDIGHKAIFVANSWRALQTIGWRHAEPVMRSLAFALLQHEGGNPAQRTDFRDQDFRDNVNRANQFRQNWQTGQPNQTAVTEFLATLRTATTANCCQQVVQKINNNVHPSSLWDALFLFAGEELMRRPNIVGLHAVTSTNALHQGYLLSANDQTRRLMLLQAAAFLVLFRQQQANQGEVVNDLRINTLEPMNPTAAGAGAITEILADISTDRVRAARKTLGLLQQAATATERAQLLMAGARRLIFNKGNNSHDYKFSSAALEDFYHATPAWRQRFLATAMFNLRGTGHDDNALIQRARQALTNG
jgi:hypothetical protein